MQASPTELGINMWNGLQWATLMTVGDKSNMNLEAEQYVQIP